MPLVCEMRTSTSLRQKKGGLNITSILVPLICIQIGVKSLGKEEMRKKFIKYKDRNKVLTILVQLQTTAPNMYTKNYNP